MTKFKKLVVSIMPFFLALLSQAQPLSGSYTIGGTTPNYATMAAAATALNTSGVSGPVIMNIAPGVYVEQITLNAIAGASAVNTITFQSQTLDSTSVTLSYNANTTSNNFLIYLNNCDHITFKGITFQPLNSTNKIAIYAYNGCSDIHITNNLFTNGWISVINAGFPSLYNEFSNNRFTTATSVDHISLTSNNINRSKGTLIENNIFEGTAKRSMYIYGEDSLFIRGNFITGSRTNNTVDLNFCGPNLTIEKNRITIASNTGIFFNQCSGNTNDRIMVRNNMIKSNNNALWVNYTNYISILNNTLQTGSSSGTCSIYFSSNNSNVDLYNNIISNTMGGFGMIFSQSSLITTTNSNYNAIYSSSSNNVRVVSTNYTLLNWTATYGKDVNSIDNQPIYVSPTDLHLDNCTPLNGMAIPLSQVLDDFDGQSRNPLTPDIGADEFDLNLNSFQDIAILGPVSPDTTSCVLENQIEVAVVNHSIFPINSFQIDYLLFDQVMYSGVINTVIPPGDTITVVLGSYDFNHNTGYDMSFVVSLPNNEPDDYPIDNAYSFTYYHLNNLTIFEKLVDDCSTNSELNIKSFPCESILWSTGETTRLITVSNPGNYSVTVTTNGGCILTDSITIN